MARNGVVFYPTWSARRSSPRRSARKRAEALLGGIQTLQQATNLSELVERAALEVLPLTEAAAAVVYLERPDAGPHLAISGALDGATADARAALVRELLPAGTAPPYALLGNAGTLLVARFIAGALRGAILAERRGTAFEDADGWVLTAFAGHLGAAAAVLSLPERHRRSKPLRESQPANAVARSSQQTADESRAGGSTSPNPLFDFGNVIGSSATIAAVRQLARVAAPSSSSLLIEGESGVGKEVLAQAIHSTGPRRERPFIAVHCAAIPRELLESELFGYEPGAFTGASPHGHAGKFEMAEGGTLLLDDIVELPLNMQAKLLRALQERAVTRLGGSRPRPVNARIVATANRPLRAAADSGAFRPDLFYRLNVLHIVIPPRRERPEDIGPLAEHFLHRYAAAKGRRLRTIGAQALRSLELCSWPGNVRELEHWIEREIHFAPPEATCLERLTREPAPVEHQRPAPVIRPLREVEREIYAAAIAEAAGDLTRAARELGVSRGKLYRKLEL